MPFALDSQHRKAFPLLIFFPLGYLFSMMENRQLAENNLGEERLILAPDCRLWSSGSMLETSWQKGTGEKSWPLHGIHEAGRAGEEGDKNETYLPKGMLLVTFFLQPDPPLNSHSAMNSSINSFKGLVSSIHESLDSTAFFVWPSHSILKLRTGSQAGGTSLQFQLWQLCQENHEFYPSWAV